MIARGDDVYRLLAEADQLPDGAAKVALVEQAANIAESHRDLDRAFAIRKDLLDACLCADNNELMLVTFTWCLVQCDRDPERFPITHILWEFRWVVSSLCEFPLVERKKIEEMKSEMARRYDQVGASRRSFYLMCRTVAMHMGAKADAVRMDTAYRNCEVDSLADGQSTELAFEITYRLFLRQPARALRAAAPFLSRQLRSEHDETTTCAEVLVPMLRAGHAPDAMRYHRRGYKLCCKSIRYIDSIAEHIVFLALTDNLGRALRLFEKHLPQAVRTSNEFSRMRFLIDALPLLDRLHKAGKPSTGLRVPPECPLAANGPRSSVPEVRKWMHDTAAELAAAFDTRNGNDYYTRRLRAVPRLQRLFSPCPMTG